jgi:hypothetical protein
METGLCADGIDNDCDGPIDCADPDCAMDPACACGNGMCVAPENPCTCPVDCGLPAPMETGLCADGIDNDCDGPIDCADPDCVTDPACLCGNGSCVPPENPCNCPADCGSPSPETVGVNCADGVDNDCDGPIDCADSGCAGDPACVCGDGTCSIGENSCNCMADCPGIPCNGDVNFDGSIDQDDLLIVGNCVDCVGSPIPACDVNCDMVIDFLDFGDELCLLYFPASDCCPLPHGGCRDTTLVQSCVLVPEAFCAFIGGVYLGDGEACPPGTGDCNGNGVSDGCEPQCTSDLDCDDGNVCTCDRCVCNVCAHQPIEYGDVNCDCIPPNLDDILCVLDGFANYPDCPASDIYPPCSGNGNIDLDDILAVLEAFAGNNPCFIQCDTPCPVGACCDGASCRLDTPTSCILEGDVYKGDDVLCPPLVPNPCP